MGPLATLVARGVFYLPLELKLADGDRCAVARHWPLSREPRMKTIALKQNWALARLHPGVDLLRNETRGEPGRLTLSGGMWKRRNGTQQQTGC